MSEEIKQCVRKLLQAQQDGRSQRETQEWAFRGLGSQSQLQNLISTKAEVIVETQTNIM